jgi:hypothetical protein
MTTEQILDELRNEIRELGKIIRDPLTSDRHKVWATMRLEMITKRLQNLNKSVEEVK